MLVKKLEPKKLQSHQLLYTRSENLYYLEPTMNRNLQSGTTIQVMCLL